MGTTGMSLLSESEKPTRSHYLILLMCWMGWVFDFYDLILFTFLLIPIGKELGLSSLALAYALGASLLASAVGGVLFGFLSDRLGRKKVLQWTILTYSFGTFLSGFAPNFFWLVLFRIMTGVGVGGEWSTGQTFICETFPPKVRGRYAAFMQTGVPVGAGLAALVGGLLMPVIGWRACFFVSALPAVLVIFIRKFLPESDLWSPPPSNPLLVLFTPEHRKVFLLAFVLAILDMSAYWFTYSWLPGYLQGERHLSIVKSAFWMLVTQGGAFLGYASFGFAADRFGRRPSFSCYAVLMASGLVMITLLWDHIARNPALILVFMFLVGFGTGMFGAYGPLISESFPTSIRNTALGTAFNVARGAQFFTPVIIAVIAAKYGFAGGISLAVLFALLAGAWIWTFPETKGKILSVS